MSIQVVCPNGHSLKVKQELAGKTGLCPLCKARVLIPRPVDAALSEDAILGFLGGRRPAMAHSLSAQGGSAPATKVASSPQDAQSPPKKACSKCNREIAVGIHICPYCHTYIARLRDF
jgi:hypothetical protein